MISRTSSTPVRLAASISTTSGWRSARIATQSGHTPQGSAVGPPGAVRAGAVQRAGDDAGGGGLADPAHPGQHEGVRDPAGGEGVAQDAHHRLLADQVVEAGRAVFAGEHPVGRGVHRLGRRVAEQAGAVRRRAVRRAAGRPGTGRTCGADFSRRGGPLVRGEQTVGGRTNDPGGNSLRLLPSGPDRVGEAPVRRRPPGTAYHAFRRRGQGAV